MSEGPGAIDARAVQVAAGQHGIVSRAQLVRCGMTKSMIEHRLRSERLDIVHRGVYRLGSLRGDLVPVRSHFMAAVVACGPGSVISHQSAGHLWEILPGGKGVGDGRATISAPRRIRRIGITSRYRPGLRRSEITEVDRIPVTTPLRTLVDLSGVLGPRQLNRSAARAERLGLLESSALAVLIHGHRGRVGAPTLRAALGSDCGPTFTRSNAEERFLELIRAGNLPLPRVNAQLLAYEVDFYWPEQRLVVEVDGFEYHRSRRAFEGDRERDRTLVAAGFQVIRLTWRQITETGPAALVSVAQALVQSRSK